MAQLFIRLATEEFAELRAMATENRRSPNEQAAHLVAQGLAKWVTQKGFELTLEERELARDLEEEIA